MGFVLVQHLAPRAHSMLPEILAKVTRMPVAEVKDGMRVEPNRIYVTPPGLTMRLKQGVLRLTVRSSPGECTGRLMTSCARWPRTRAAAPSG